MKRVVLLFFILSLIAALAGCSPKGDPQETLKTFYNNVMDANYDAAYEILAEADRKATSKEDFVLFMRLNADLYKLNGVEIIQTDNNSDSVVFDVVEKLLDIDKDKEESVSYKCSVVAENGEWKVFSDKKYGEGIPALQNSIGWLYINGTKIEGRNENEAAKWFHEALKRDASYYQAHYGLSIAYASLGRYEEAIAAAKQFVSSTEGKKEQAGGYNVIGICYEVMKDFVKAKEAYQKAVELDPTNENAMASLARVK
ncbi:hypothetical protein T458_02275 [Brevibacillus panacihumi W25]|uniref:NTF2-like N-terminal transpeptidase domain-containing protein n=1 Tax=Brevibacillus panacihumi W25 TaxID=1408254 RepID=V6MDZ7_9BACL|nr:tetratricopeptide repeat protein [Brevibacillus panacihumi]EST56749.1 hypothetical protein T458_02275 [Brevibacillus panacihumi W25]